MCELSDFLEIGQRAGNRILARFFQNGYWICEIIDDSRFLVRGTNYLTTPEVISNYKTCTASFLGGITDYSGYTTPATFLTPSGYTREVFPDGAVYFKAIAITTSTTTLAPVTSTTTVNNVTTTTVNNFLGTFKKYLILQQANNTLYYPCASKAQSTTACFNQFIGEVGPILLESLPNNENIITCEEGGTTNMPCTIQFLTAVHRFEAGCQDGKSYLFASINHVGGSGLRQYRVLNTAGEIIHDWTAPIEELAVLFKVPFGVYTIIARDANYVSCYSKVDNIVVAESACSGTQTTTTTTVDRNTFSVLVSNFNCSTGVLTVGHIGAINTTVEYAVSEVGDYKSENTFIIPSSLRNGTEFTIYARRVDTGIIVSIKYVTNCTTTTTTNLPCSMTISSLTASTSTTNRYTVNLANVGTASPFVWFYGKDVNVLNGPFEPASQTTNSLVIDLPSGLSSDTYIVRVAKKLVNCVANTTLNFVATTTKPACNLTIQSASQDSVNKTSYNVKLAYSPESAKPFSWRIRRASDYTVWDDNNLWIPDANGNIQVDFGTKPSGQYYIEVFSSSMVCSDYILVNHSGYVKPCTMSVSNLGLEPSFEGVYRIGITTTDPTIAPYTWVLKRKSDGFVVATQSVPVTANNNYILVSLFGLPSTLYTLTVSATNASCSANLDINYATSTTSTTASPCLLSITNAYPSASYSWVYKVKLNYSGTNVTPLGWRIKRADNTLLVEDSRDWTPDVNGEIEVDFMTAPSGSYKIEVFSKNSTCFSSINILNYVGINSQTTTTTTQPPVTTTTCDVFYNTSVNDAQFNLYRYNVANNTSTLIKQFGTDYADIALKNNKMYMLGFGFVDIYDFANNTTQTVNMNPARAGVGLTFGKDGKLYGCGTVLFDIDVSGNVATNGNTSIICSLNGRSCQGDVIYHSQSDTYFATVNGNSTDADLEKSLLIQFNSSGTLIRKVPLLENGSPKYGAYGLFVNSDKLYISFSDGKVYVFNPANNTATLDTTKTLNSGLLGATQNEQCNSFSLTAS